MRYTAALCVGITAALAWQTPAPERPGPLAGGGALLDNGWRLRPAGRQVPLGALPLAAAVSPDGKYALALNSGASAPSISVLEIATQREIGRTPVADAWLGLTFSPKGDRVYVGGGAQAAVFEFAFAAGKLTPARTFPVAPAEKRTPKDFVGDVTFDAAGRMLYAADLFRDSIAVINPQSGMVIERIATGRRPYRILFPAGAGYFFVSSWADGAVYQHDSAKGEVLARLRLGAHPTDMVWLPGKPATEDEGQFAWVAARLIVAAANTNNVYVLGAASDGELRQIETINISLTPWQPAGATPSALALSPDRKRLFVACSDANAVAVADVSGARTAPLGFIPAARYPTAARQLADGQILILNGSGSAAFLTAPDEQEFGRYSNTVLENTPYRDNLLEDAGTGQGSPIPSRPGETSPIQHVVYIVKGAAGNPGGPNHRKLASEFVTLENFYALGPQWAIAGIASDFVEKMSPRPFDYEGGEPAAIPPSAYLWTNASSAGVSLRNYGFFVTNRPLQEVKDGVQVAAVKDPTLNHATNWRFRGPDSAYPDSERAKVFLQDLAEYEKSGQMPALILLRLPNDNSTGAAIADHDAALGRIVEAISKSRFWPSAAVFIAEESPAQPGAPSPAFVVSPYVKRRSADRTMYNTASMLRTIELILGLRPMTVFDAGARPMSALFQPAADPTPYAANH